MENKAKEKETQIEKYTSDYSQKIRSDIICNICNNKSKSMLCKECFNNFHQNYSKRINSLEKIQDELKKQIENREISYNY
jgi:hypothetical protein